MYKLIIIKHVSKYKDDKMLDRQTTLLLHNKL